MTIKTREPSDAFKKQVSDYVPVKKRRSWREEQEANVVIEDSTKANSATVDNSMENTAIAKKTIDDSTIVKKTTDDSNSGTRIETIKKLTNTIYTIAKNTIANSAIDLNLLNKPGATSIDLAIESSTIAKNTLDIAPIEFQTVLESSIVNYSIDKHSNQSKVTAILEPSIVNSAIAKITIADNNSTSNKVTEALKSHIIDSAIDNSAIAKNIKTDLTSVFSSAIQRIDNSSAIIIYLLLWTKATDRKIMISLNDLVNSVKLSKRTIQEALKKLQDLHFISKEQINPTSTPIYTLKID